ncbi:MAG: tRNA-dihydrouridine synthase family protein [Bacilli bacterium]|nr:tRNA-dihydrouridine synthase family protein [Bacilli bacterium]
MERKENFSISFAPLEGVTMASFRNCFSHAFPGIDRYYIPFLSPVAKGKLPRRNERDVDPKANDVDGFLVPQIISKNAGDTINCIKHLKDLGYTSVNLNFGCPSGTVVAKGRGGGMLIDLMAMRKYLEEVFSRSVLPISIKTRIGVSSPEEWEDILNVYKDFPIQELIIHPRTVKEVYHGPLHLEAIEKAKEMLSVPLIYNGDLKTKEDIERITSKFPYLSGVMIGRGFLENPDMLIENKSEEERKTLIKSYVDSISKTLIEDRGWGNASFPIKAIWNSLSNRFSAETRVTKNLLKEKDQEKFFLLVDEMFKSPLK